MRLLVLAMILCASVASAGGRVLIYGDSYNNANELDTPLIAAGFDVYHAANAGAKAGDYASDDCTSANDYQMNSCVGFGEYQMKYVDSACRSYVESTAWMGTIDNSECGLTGSPNSSSNDDACCGTSNCTPTCLEDLTLYEDDLCLIMFGTNGLHGNDVAWDEDSVILIAMIDAWDSMVQHADDHGLSCVLSFSFPRRYSAADVFRLQEQTFYNDLWATRMEEAYSHHVVFNTFAEINELETIRGTPFVDNLYNADGIHPSTVGFEWLGKGVADSMLGIQELRRNQNTSGKYAYDFANGLDGWEPTGYGTAPDGQLSGGQLTDTSGTEREQWMNPLLKFPQSNAQRCYLWGNGIESGANNELGCLFFINPDDYANSTYLWASYSGGGILSLYEMTGTTIDATISTSPIDGNLGPGDAIGIYVRGDGADREMWVYELNDAVTDIVNASAPFSASDGDCAGYLYGPDVVNPDTGRCLDDVPTDFSYGYMLGRSIGLSAMDLTSDSTDGISNVLLGSGF